MQTLTIEEEMTIATAAKQKKELLAFLDSGDELELNLCNVNEIDTAGLQLLMLIKREAAQFNKTLRIVMHSQAVVNILELTRLTRSFGDQVVLFRCKE